MSISDYKIAVAGIFHETNTFAPGLTGEAAFREEWIVGYEAFAKEYSGTRTTMGGLLEVSKVHGAKLLPGFYTAALPSGIVASPLDNRLIETMLESIDTNADGLVLIMHGAMVSENYPDFEGECLRRLRGRFGSDFPIVLTIDLHANISEQMAALSDVIVIYDTYPHIDMYERGVEAYELLVRMLRGEIRPCQAYVHTGMLLVPQVMITDEGSMKVLRDRAVEMEKNDKVLNVSVAGGFPYSDVQDAGMSFVVTTDGDSVLAKQYAAELKSLAIERRETFNVAYWSPSEAIEQALSEPEGPVILVEGSDNVGGGAPADATHLLEHLLDLPERALIVIRDPEAVKIASAIGIGGDFTSLVGGKSDTLHGKPVHIHGKVRLLFDGFYHNIGPFRAGQSADMGITAVVESGNLTIVLTEKRMAPWDLGHIRYAGLWPTDFKIIVVKSAVAWQTAFGTFAKRVLNIDTPGCCSANLQHFQYEHAKGLIAPISHD
ncbi:M81 family metallopeptidase [Cohnella silvisoli]|uniref:M81 family metallopeptidase n=1 Tax=Cohnella silvisoli TaxID=2873699 RepID=A0ABV1KXP6_9BACL|nr:M81 family metallopeptidase [Cohnella silvisoli]MCD9023834.1 M81 family metallopeptidase [Cohnella silvisoli]